MERRLAAILAADVVAYSRLMGNNEVGTLERLEALKAGSLDPLIARYHGRIVKLMGDGFLIEFASVVDALECAIAWQEDANAQARLIGEDQAIRFRIGINLGDVIVKGDDVFGDGVIVAARLEALAEPGGILVSRTVVDHVKGKITPGFEDLGKRQLKNISDPVQVLRVVPPQGAAVPLAGKDKTPRSGHFAAMAISLAVLLVIGGLSWQRPWETREEPASEANMAFPLPEKPSIAVLPFNNMSQDASQEYFVDGMTEDLITDLSKISGLFVIARNSSFTYKGKAVKIRKVAEDLGVRYVLEGSVRRDGDQVRINAQLIDATTGGHLWADRYDGASADVFALQDKVTRNIVAALALALTPAETQGVSSTGTDNATAYDAYLLGLSYFHRRNPIDNATAKTHFEKAVEIDPGYTEAYAALAKVYVQALTTTDEEYSGKLGFAWYSGSSRPWKYLQKAKPRPNTDYFIVRARLAIRRHQPGRAIAEAKRALALNSNDAEAMEIMAEALIFAGQPKAGIEYAQRAMRQNPIQLGRPLYFIGLAEFALGNNEEAVSFLNRAIRHESKEIDFFIMLAAAYGELGQTAQANDAIEKYNLDSATLNRSLHELVSQYPFSNADILDRFAEGLKIAGVPVRSGGYLPLHTANQLTGAEIKSLLFGKQIKGTVFWDFGGPVANEWRQLRAADGTVKHSGYSIQAGVSSGDAGTGRIEEDMLCEIWPKLAEDIEACVVVYRVTDRIGRIKWGDYIMVTDSAPNPFSVAK